jgi:hypothetical protein
VGANIRPGVQRRGSVPGGGNGACSIRGPYRWRQASSQVYRDVGVDWGVGRGQALYEDRTGGGKVYRDVGVDREVGRGQALSEDRIGGCKHQARCTET